MKKICWLWLLCLFFVGCAVDLDQIDEYDGFYLDRGRGMIVFPDREFRYRLDKDPVENRAKLYVYYTYNPLSGFNPDPIQLYREENDSITLFQSEYSKEEEDWSAYDMIHVANQLLPRRAAFFTDLATFWLRPWGAFFLYGGLFFLIPRPMSYWWIRTRRYCPEVVEYEEEVHRPLCMKFGLAFTVVSFLSWVLSQILGVEIPMFAVFIAIMVVIMKIPVPEGARPSRR